jgi:hypothetical protein
MSLILDGSNGLSDIDGTAATPAIRGTDANTGIFFPAADTIAFSEGGAESMRIDASGNLGIGTSSPVTKLDVNGPASVTSFTGTTRLGVTVRGSTAATDYSGIDFIGGNQTQPLARIAVLSTGGGSLLQFGTSNSYGSGITNNAMTIDSSGNVLVNTASAISGSNQLQVINGAGDSTQIRVRHSSASSGRSWRYGADSSNTIYIVNQDSTGVFMGNGSTSWSSLSDERSKDIIEPITNASEKVATLRSVIGKYKTDEEGIRRSFLIAQDVQKVLPEAVSVQSDEQGTLGLSYTDVIPLLVAAVKELKATVDAQAARIAALEAAV